MSEKVVSYNHFFIFFNKKFKFNIYLFDYLIYIV